MLPGNHDDAARQFHGLEMGGVKLLPWAVHVTADGRRLAGDPRRPVRPRRHPNPDCSPPSAGSPTTGCSLANRWWNSTRRALGKPPYSLAGGNQGTGQIGVQIHQPLRGATAARSPAAGARRRGVRPHPPRRDPRGRGTDLPQLRRLGRELHRARRTCGWAHRVARRSRMAGRGGGGARGPQTSRSQGSGRPAGAALRAGVRRGGRGRGGGRWCSAMSGRGGWRGCWGRRPVIPPPLARSRKGTSSSPNLLIP